MKKAQISIFILIGLIILLVFSLVFFYPKKTSIENNIIQDKASIEFMLTKCLSQTLKEGVEKVGKNGGYLFGNKDLLIQLTSKNSYSYLYYSGVRHELNSINITKDLEKYVNDNFRYCIDDFSAYNKFYNSIIFKDINTTIIIAENEVIADVVFPVKFIKNKDSFVIDKISSKYYVSLNKIILETNYITLNMDTIQKEIKNAILNNYYPSINIPLNYEKKGDLEIFTIKYPNEENRILWKIKNQNFEFLFATYVETK